MSHEREFVMGFKLLASLLLATTIASSALSQAPPVAPPPANPPVKTPPVASPAAPAPAAPVPEKPPESHRVEGLELAVTGRDQVAKSSPVYSAEADEKYCIVRAQPVKIKLKDGTEITPKIDRVEWIAVTVTAADGEKAIQPTEGLTETNDLVIVGMPSPGGQLVVYGIAKLSWPKDGQNMTLMTKHAAVAFDVAKTAAAPPGGEPANGTTANGTPANGTPPASPAPTGLTPLPANVQGWSAVYVGDPALIDKPTFQALIPAARCGFFSYRLGEPADDDLLAKKGLKAPAEAVGAPCLIVLQPVTGGARIAPNGQAIKLSLGADPKRNAALVADVVARVGLATR